MHAEGDILQKTTKKQQQQTADIQTSKQQQPTNTNEQHIKTATHKNLTHQNKIFTQQSLFCISHL